MDTPNGFCLHTLSIKEFKGWQEWNLFPYFLGHNSVTETLTLLGILTAYSYSIKDFQRVTGETVCNKMRTLSLEKPVSQEYFSPKNFSSAILHFQQQSADIPADKVETSPSLHLYREDSSPKRSRHLGRSNKCQLPGVSLSASLPARTHAMNITNHL